MKIEPYLSLYTKLKYTWIKKLDIKPDTLNLIKEKVGESLGLSSKFYSNMILKFFISAFYFNSTILMNLYIIIAFSIK